MAIGTPASVGEASANNASTTIALTTTGGASVGDRVIVVVADDGASGVPTGVVDSRGNTYSPDHAGVSNPCGRVFSAHVTTALQVGDTITGTVAGANRRKLIAACRVTGIARDAVDKSASATGSSAGWSSGSTGTTSWPDELVFGFAVGRFLALLEQSSSPGVNLVELHDMCPGLILDFTGLTTVYRIVNATGSYQANGTWSTASTWGSVVVTYKAARPGALALAGAGA